MSIASQIEILKNDKTSIKASINNKNIAVSNTDGFDNFASIIEMFSKDGFQSYSREWTPNEDTQILNITDLPFEPDYMFLTFVPRDDDGSRQKLMKTFNFDFNAYKDTVNKPVCFTSIGTDNSTEPVAVCAQGNSNGFKTGGCTITPNSIYLNLLNTRGTFLTTKYFSPYYTYFIGFLKSKYKEDYFQIDSNGVLALKPTYRGTGVNKVVDGATVPCEYSVSDNGINNVGSLMNDLPEELWLPSYVNNVKVLSLAEGMFAGNTKVKKIHFQSSTTVIPDYFCRRAAYLENVYNTENITILGNSAFQSTSLKEVYFPKVITLNANVFNTNGKLKTAVLSDDIEILPDGCFSGCYRLENLVGCGSVKTIGDLALWKTYSLKSANGIINSVIAGGSTSSIGTKAIIHSRINADWKKVADSGCSTVSTSTPYQYHPAYNQLVEKQNSNTIVEKINTLGSTFNQMNEKFKDIVIGASLSEQGGIGSTGSKVYGKGCVLLACMHAYCALKGYDDVQSPVEVEQLMLQDAIANGTETEFRNAMANYTYNHSKGLAILRTVGLNVVEHTAPSTDDTDGWQTYVNELYNAIQTDNTYLAVPVDGSGTTGHEFMVYGVKSNGELLIADSGDGLGALVEDYNEAVSGTMLPQSFLKKSFAVVTLNEI